MSGEEEVLTIVTETAPAPMPIAETASVGMSEYQALGMFARYNPRDERQCVASVLAALENNPAFAEKGIYQIPRAGTTIYGTGIHGARAIATAWKNNLSGALIVNPDPECTIVRGVFVDGQNGRFSFRERKVPRTVHRRKGGSVRLTEEDFDNQIRIEQSKAERDAILGGVPRYVVDQFFDAAFKIAVQKAEQSDRSPLERWEAATEALKKLKVTEDAALAFLGMNKREELTHALVTKLGQTLRGIQQGESTVAGVFGAYMEAEKAPEKPDLGKATVKEAPTKPTEEPPWDARKDQHGNPQDPPPVEEKIPMPDEAQPTVGPPPNAGLTDSTKSSPEPQPKADVTAFNF